MPSHRSAHLLKIAFYASLVFKAVFAGLEILSGMFAAFISQHAVIGLARLATQEELAEDPKDVVANYLLHAAQQFSISAQHFAALYLLSHGIIKLWLIVGLWRKKLWYYPTAMVVFALFVIYQMYLLSIRFSIGFLILMVIDAVVIVLTWHEYALLRRGTQQQ
jgi:uncharacterized membrane protein